MKAGWSKVALGEVLDLSLDAECTDVSRIYPTLGVYGFGRGVITDKAPVQGSQIAATSLYRVHAGQFIYSKLKAFEGAFAIVPPEGDGRYVTNEFPTFNARTNHLDIEYLGWVFRAQATWLTLRSQSVGIGARRERLHPEQLLASKILLPPLNEQRRIVAFLETVSEQLKRRAESANRQESDLAAVLKIAFRRITAESPQACMADVAPLKRRPVEINPDAVYEEIGARAFGRGLFRKPNVLGNALSWQKLFRVETGDLVISNIKAWEGAFAIAEPPHHGKVGSHRYLTCVADQQRLLPGVLWFFLQSRDGLLQIQEASPGSADRNRTLAQDRLEAILVPVPPLKLQQGFENVRLKVRDFSAAHAALTRDASALLPSMLNKIVDSAAC